jgi:hypothetical protein
MVMYASIAVTMGIFVLGATWKLSSRLSVQDYMLKWVMEELRDLKKKIDNQ